MCVWGGEGKSTGDGEEREKENRTIDKIKGARTTRREKGLNDCNKKGSSEENATVLRRPQSSS